MNIKKVFIIFSIGVILIGSGVSLINTYEGQYNKKYEYTISTEPVQTEYDNTSVYELEDLSEEEQELFKDAFSKTNSFYNGAKVTVERPNSVDTETDFDILRIDGSPILVSVSESNYDEPVFELKIGQLSFSLGILVSFALIVALYQSLWKNSNNNTNTVKINLSKINFTQKPNNSTEGEQSQ